MATRVVKDSPGGGEYASVALACADSTADGDIISIEGTWGTGSGSDDTSNVTVDYATTIQTDASSACPMYLPASPTFYRHKVASGHAFTLNADLTLDGVFIESQSTGTSDEIYRINADSLTITSKNSILAFNSRNSEQDIAYTNTRDNLTISFENCGFYNVYRGVIDYYNSIGTHNYNFNSCHAYNIGYADLANSRSGLVGVFGSSGTINVHIFNSLIHSNLPGYSVIHGESGPTFNEILIDRSKTNALDWTNITSTVTTETITDSPVEISWTDGTPSAGDIAVQDITSGVNLKLQDDTNNGAQDVHADGSGASLTMPSADALGTTRPQNTNYDLGFHEIVAGGGGITITANQNETGDTQTATIDVINEISSNQSEVGDTNTVQISPLVKITTSLSEAGDTTSASISSANTVSASQTETGDATASTFNVINEITATQTESGDSQLVTIETLRNITANQSDVGDNQTTNIEVINEISASQSETGDTQSASIIGVLTSLVTGNQAEAGDSTTSTLQVINEITSNQSESGDTENATLNVINQVTSNQSESGDTQSATLTGILTSTVSASQTDAGDTTTSNIISLRNVLANQSETGDTQSANLQLVGITDVTAIQTETGDIQTVSLDVLNQIAANQAETGDITLAAIGGKIPNKAEIEYTLPESRLHYSVPNSKLHYTG